MPRLATSLLRRAYALDAHLPALLGPCRDLSSAQNELRWLREHVDSLAKARRARGDVVAKRALLADLVRQRARGKPLQYILGSEWFGDVEIRCRKGVLIPRQDTAASISHLVRFLRGASELPAELRVLDLCTGTGCIPLLFAHEFCDSSSSATELRILGVDVSPDALKLAAHNLKRTRRLATQKPVEMANIRFLGADILSDPFADQDYGPPSLKAALNLERAPQFWDIVISNPPYISPREYWKTTTRSVRGFEPKLALVPPNVAASTDVEQGDAFYQPLLNVALDVEAKVVLLEIADAEQALRVARAAREMNIFDGIEIWRDRPDGEEHLSDDTTTPLEHTEFPVFGQGNARTVLCYRGPGTQWLQKTRMVSSPTARPSDPDSAVSTTKEGGRLEPTFHLDPRVFGEGRPLRELRWKSGTKS